MSFAASKNKVKSFVTEDEANELDAKKQKEWERVRSADDPLERPPEETRSLFEQLQAQKDKVQQEHDEKFSLKNMIRGIDNDEATFLEFACKQQAEMDGRRFADTSEIKEFRSEVAQLQATLVTSPTNVLPKPEKRKRSNSNKKSQVELLAGVIKRKKSESSDSEQPKSQSQQCSSDPRKRQRSDSGSDVPSSGTTTPDKKPEADTVNVGYCQPSDYKTMSIPSLGVYSDSSDSESSSSDPELAPSLFSTKNT